MTARFSIATIYVAITLEPYVYTTPSLEYICMGRNAIITAETLDVTDVLNIQFLSFFFEFEISTHTYHKATSDSDIIVHKYILQIKITSRSGRYCLFCIAIMDKISNIRAQKTIVHIAIKACVV